MGTDRGRGGLSSIPGASLSALIYPYAGREQGCGPDVVACAAMSGQKESYSAYGNQQG